MRLRKVDADGDYRFGAGASDFWKDVPDAPAQLAVSRMHLEVGQWIFDRGEGIDYRTQVLGKRTETLRDPAIRARLLGTQGVTAIAAYASVLNRNTRGLAVEATLDTQYGATTLKEPI